MWGKRPQVHFLSATTISVPYEEKNLIKYSSGTLLTTSDSEQHDDQPQRLSEDSVHGASSISRESRLMYKKIPLLIFIVWVWKGDDVPNSITDHMLMALIIVGLYGYLWLSFPRNSIKIGISCILEACSICIYVNGIDHYI